MAEDAKGDGFTRMTEPVLYDLLANGGSSRIPGIGCVRTNHLPDDTLLPFGKSQLALGIDSTASLTVAPTRYPETGETAVIGTFRVDTAPLKAAVVIATGITA